MVLLRTGAPGLLETACNQYRERVTRAACADRDPDAGQPGVLQKLFQFFVVEPEPLVAEARADPLLLVAAQLEEEHPSAGFYDARGLGQRAGGVLGVVQRLRQQRDVDAQVLQRQLLELAALPFNVLYSTALRALARPVEDGLRPIDGDHPRRKPAGFDRQIAFAAPEIRNHDRREKMPQRARPGGPAPSWDDLAALAVGAVIVEILFPHAADFFEPRVILAAFSRGRGGVEMRAEERPHRAETVGYHNVACSRQARREAEKREPGVAPLFHQARVFQQPQMTRHAGLGDPENRGQLGDVQAFAVEQAEDPQPGLVPQQPEQVRRLRRPIGGLLRRAKAVGHIYESTCIDAEMSRGSARVLWAIPL